MRLAREQRFYKMSGSGNDFVVVDARQPHDKSLEQPGTIRALCARGTGVGADGLVLIEAEPDVDFRMVYYNADGSRASMCGNAALCCTRLVAETDRLAGELVFETDSGRVRARMRDGCPEIDLAAVSMVRPDAGIAIAPGERKLGFALVGVPHVVALVDDVVALDVLTRGRALRTAPELRPAGANANFVTRSGEDWEVRTYERGVEGETLACGTGAVASAILLTEWGQASGPVRLRTRSGAVLTVRLQRTDGAWRPSLAGEGRIVYEGLIREI